LCNKNVILTPKTEWIEIEKENTSHLDLFIKYVLPLSLIPAIAAFIGYGLIGVSVPFFGRIHSMEWGVRQAIVQWVACAGGVYLSAFIIDMLATSFGATKNLNKAFSLVGYSYTPAMVAGIFYILPGSLGWLALVAGIYSLYLLYIGLQPMMKVPAEKNTGYFVVSLLVMIVVMSVLSFGLARILVGNLYNVGGLY
jgi:hypothetical protein